MIHFDNSKNVRRWISCFDLLGTREFLATGKYLDVFIKYREASELCQLGLQSSPGLRHSWFSDTFLIIADDDSTESFALLDRMVRDFAYFLVQSRIPFRGAVSCDYLYCDFTENILFGTALVEAYEFGERQNWIGFLLSPSAVKRLEDLGTSYGFHYSLWDVPWNPTSDGMPKKLPACRLGSDVNDSDSCITILKEMMSACVREDIKMKYSLTMKFLEGSKHFGNG